MNTRLVWIGAFGLGAGLMFLFDPHAGGARRRQLQELVSRIGRQLSARRPAVGAGRRAAAEHVDDETLTERVKAVVRSVVSHPKAIDVWVLDGHVTLSGPVLAHEIPPLMSAVNRVPGIRGVEPRLDTEIHPGSVAGLRSDE